MKTRFHLVLNLRTTHGYESFGRFALGSDRVAAYALFGQLKGHTEVTEGSPLSLDLVEESEGLPLNLKMLTCTLEELADNVKIITRETFKRCNLKEGEG